MLDIIKFATLKLSFLREKSSFNEDAADLLIQNNLYAPSVHCSYYSCFQFLKYTLKTYKKSNYDLIETNSLAYPRGSHTYIIDNVLSEFRKKVLDNKEYAKLKRTLSDLKEFRTRSDYYNIEISIDEAEKCQSFNKSIKQEIKSKLK